MSGALDRAVARIRKLPRDQQEIAAAILEDFARHTGVLYVLSPEENRLIDEGLAELDRGQTVSHEEIKALLAKYTL